MRSFRGTCSLTGVGLLVVLTAAPAEAWRARLARSSNVAVMTVDRAGAVFACPERRVAEFGVVVKLDAADGRVRWRRHLARGTRLGSFLAALETTAGGDVVVVGRLVPGETESTFFVARLAGRSGAVRWRANLRGRPSPSSSNRALAVARAPDGDLVVAGSLDGAAPNDSASDFAVVKLSGENGAERWRFTLGGGADQIAEATALAVDAAGDVLALGLGTIAGFPASAKTLVKLAGDDGRLLWRRDVDGVSFASNVVLDAAGDVFLPGTIDEPGDERFAVVKLAGGTGETIWTNAVGVPDCGSQRAVEVALVPSGDVAAVGPTSDSACDHPKLTAVLLDARTGTERWRQRLEGNAEYGSVAKLSVMPDGDVVVGGTFTDRNFCRDFSFARLAAASGEVRKLRSLDGTTGCDLGFDQDSLSALQVDPAGRIVVAGFLSDGPRGRYRGVVAKLR